MKEWRAKWYVYELIDPRTDTVFYIGKGKNQRIDDHEWEAKGTNTSHKCNKIRSIWADGLEIGKRKIAQFWDEEAAYECEAERIDEIGLDNLTNVLRGGVPSVPIFKIREKAQRTQESHAEPLTSDIGMMIVRNWTGWVAQWLRRPTATSQLTVDIATGRFPKLQKTLIEWLVNKMIPQAWDKAINNPENHAELSALFEPWNIRLEFVHQTS